MTSTPSGPSRLIAVAVLLVCAIAAAAVYALRDHPDAAPTGVKQPPRAGVTASAAPAGWVPDNPRLADVCRTALPGQARDTLALIAAHGPFPYRTDGVVFENRESRLPGKRAGYYHEYTVVTPGSADRGTRRVVTGGLGEQYWTGDHYASFQEIDARC
jgi:ribonuclease T1